MGLGLQRVLWTSQTLGCQVKVLGLHLSEPQSSCGGYISKMPEQLLKYQKSAINVSY